MGAARWLLHCGISVASAARFMADMGHQQKGSTSAFLVCFFLRKRTLPGLCRGPPARAGLATGANVRLPIPIAAFGPQGRFSQLSAIGLNRSRGRVPVAQVAHLSHIRSGRKRPVLRSNCFNTLRASPCEQIDKPKTNPHRPMIRITNVNVSGIADTRDGLDERLENRSFE